MYNTLLNMSEIKTIMFHPNCLESVEEVEKNCKLYNSSDKYNPKCAIPKLYAIKKVDVRQYELHCTEDMSCIPDLCRLHHARMAKWQQVDCHCTKKHMVCNGNFSGIHIFRLYYNSWDMPSIYPNGKLCCCYCHPYWYPVGKCGDMLVCNKHAKDHSAMRTMNYVREEYKIENGAVKVLTPNITGIKKGNGFIVYSSPDGKNNTLIKTYKDAMNLHLHCVDIDNAKSFDWLVIASHMEDRPSIIKPIIVDGLVYVATTQDGTKL